MTGRSLKNTNALLRLVIGRIEAPPCEVAVWSPGQMILLDVETTPGVELSVDGLRLGSGELVDVGGKLGVRVTSVDEARAHEQ